MKTQSGVECWVSILNLTFSTTGPAQLSTPRAGRTLLQGNSLVLIYVKGWVGHKAIECGQKGLFKIFKDPIGNRTRNLASCGSVPQPNGHHSACTALLQKPVGSPPVKNLPAIYWNRLLVTAFKGVRQISVLSRINPIHAKPSCLRSIVNHPPNYSSGCLRGRTFPSVFATNLLHAFSSPVLAACPAHLIPLGFHRLIIQMNSVNVVTEMEQDIWPATNTCSFNGAHITVFDWYQMSKLKDREKTFAVQQVDKAVIINKRQRIVHVC